MMHDTRPPAWWQTANGEFVYEQPQFPIYDQPTPTPFQNSYQQHLPSASNSPLSYVSDVSTSYLPCSYPDQFSGGSSNSSHQSYSPSPVTGYQPTYAPCEGPRPWNYAYCYGYYGEPACPLINMVDMEDFM